MGSREGRTFAISRMGLLVFGKFDGNEETSVAHDRLRAAMGWSEEECLVGGGAHKSGEGSVKAEWISGFLQYGRDLKPIAKGLNMDRMKKFRNLRELDDAFLAKINFDAASSDVEMKIAELWDCSEFEATVGYPLSETSMYAFREAAGKMQQTFAEQFPEVDVLHAYGAEVQFLRGAAVKGRAAKEASDSAIGSAADFHTGEGATSYRLFGSGDMAVEDPRAKEANFSPKGAASGLKGAHLQKLLEDWLPAVCPGVEELTFDHQTELMTTAQSGAVLAEMLGRLPDLAILNLRETGLTAAALAGLVANLPEGLRLVHIRLSDNPNMLLERGIDALVELVVKLDVLNKINMAGNGYTGEEAELKQKLKSARPGLRVFC